MCYLSGLKRQSPQVLGDRCLNLVQFPVNPIRRVGLGDDRRDPSCLLKKRILKEKKLIRQSASVRGGVGGRIDLWVKRTPEKNAQ